MEVVFENIEKRYGDFYAVRNLNLKINDGALHFLLGPSGCGKTTTLRMLAGLEKVTAGNILFDGKDVTKQPAAERGIGMVFQNYALWPHMTVLKNIEYGLNLRKLAAAEKKRRVDEVLEITQLTRFVERYPGQLSGGQQQRVALARALAIRPNVLLLDEPLSNLDAKLRVEMRDNITRIHRQTKITTVYVTHDQKEALSMGSSISVMHAGKLIQTDSPRQLYTRPNTPFIAGFIGETNLVPGVVKDRDGKELSIATDLGLLRAGHAVQDFKSGDKVMLSLRPEAIRLMLDGQGPLENQFHLTLEHYTYLGESEQIFFKAGDATVKVTLFHVPDIDLKPGTKIQCGVAADDVLALPQDEDIGQGT